MRLCSALKEKLHDVRLREKIVAEGKVSQKQVDDYLNSLPDESQNLEYIKVIDSDDDEE